MDNNRFFFEPAERLKMIEIHTKMIKGKCFVCKNNDFLEQKKCDFNCTTMHYLCDSCCKNIDEHKKRGSYTYCTYKPKHHNYF